MWMDVRKRFEAGTTENRGDNVDSQSGLQNPELYIEGHHISVKKSIRYLGIELDQKITFTLLTKKAAKVGAESAKAIGRLLHNVKGPSYYKRKLLSSVVHSKILYASAV